jgi:hypothetical protein
MHSCALKPYRIGGAKEDRTPDLLRARQALSQLSYGPVQTTEDASTIRKNLPILPFCVCPLSWWAWADLNGRPHPYQGCALTN